MPCFGRPKVRPTISVPIAPGHFSPETNEWSGMRPSIKTSLGMGAEVIPPRADVVKKPQPPPQQEDDNRYAYSKPQLGRVLDDKLDDDMFQPDEMDLRLQATPKTPTRVNAPMDPFFHCPKVVNVNSCTVMDFLNSYDTVFLAYYQPQETRSKSFAPFYSQSASRDLNAVYAAVDCDKDPAVCISTIRASNPVVRLYSKGKIVNEYSMTEVSQGILPTVSAAAPVLEPSEPASCQIKQFNFSPVRAPRPSP